MFVFIVSLNIFFGSNLVFLPLHSLGLFAFPRRITDYGVCYVGYSICVTIGLLFLFMFCCCIVLFFVFVVCFLRLLFFFIWCFLLVSCFFLFFCLSSVWSLFIYSFG